MPSTAMEPTIKKDAIVWSKELSGQEKDAVCRGDIVVFVKPHTADTLFLKRVVAVGGDTVELREQQLYIDDAPVMEEYGKHPARRGHTGAGRWVAMSPQRHAFGPVTVPEGHLFMLGDNWEMSEDSRVFGFVETSAIVARVL